MEEAEAQLLQTALVLSQAVHLRDDGLIHSHITDSTLWTHNIQDYATQWGPPIEYLLAQADSRVPTDCKTSLSLQPTVYVAFGEYLGDGPVHDLLDEGASAPPLGQHLRPLRAVQLPDITADAQCQALALWVAEALPMQTLFNFLGQGYQIVLTGYGFGGLVAHTVAMRLLTMVRQEITMAKQMGINLSALAQTEERVTSFAFCSPLLANSSLHDELHALGLADKLHTIWRTHDASPYFFSLCGELSNTAASMCAAQQPADNTVKPAVQLHSASLQAALTFASALHNALQSQSTRSRGRQQYHCNPGALTDTDTPVSSAPNSSQDMAAAGAQDFRRTNTSDMNDRPSGGGACVSRHLLAQSSTRKSPTGSRQGTLLSNGTGNSTSAATAVKGSVRRQDRGHVAESPPKQSHLSSGSGPPALSRMSSSQLQGSSSGTTRTSSPNVRVLVQAAAKPTASSTVTTPKQRVDTTSSDAWKKTLQTLLESCDQGGLQQYTPLGKVWVLNVKATATDKKTTSQPAVAAGKLTVSTTSPGKLSSTASPGKPGLAAGKAAVPSSKAASGSADEARAWLTLLAPGRVSSTGLGWFSEGNSQLLDTWEWSLDELGKELMEAFPWVTFKKAVQIDGKFIARAGIIRKNSALLLE